MNITQQFQNISTEKNLRDLLIKDIYEKALKIPISNQRSNWLTPLLNPSFSKIIKMALMFDAQIDQYGFCGASSRILPEFVKTINIKGKDFIPSDKPLIIAANHPGTLDIFIIASAFNRKDIRIIARGSPFFRHFPNLSKYMLYTTIESQQRMGVLRKAINHLKLGGALLINPSGTIDPDPVLQKGAEDAIQSWSPSIEFILQKVPETQLIVAIVGGVLSPISISNPIVKLKRNLWEQQAIAEILQMVLLLHFPKLCSLSPIVTFSEPIPYSILAQRSDNSEEIMQNIRMLAIEQLRSLQLF